MSAAAAFIGSDLLCIRAERPVFAGLDFALEPGDALKLVGPNGSGKSSLLRVMAGLLRPASGALRWGDEDVLAEPSLLRGAVAYLGHLEAVKPALTARENLAFWLALTGSDPAAPDAALATFGLAPLAEVPARFLSAGQRRRLALARLAAQPARLWLLDEPTVGLDRAALAALEAALARHRASGGMVALATHTDLALPGAAELALDAYAPRRLAAA